MNEPSFGLLFDETDDIRLNEPRIRCKLLLNTKTNIPFLISTDHGIRWRVPNTSQNMMLLIYQLCDI